MAGAVLCVLRARFFRLEVRRFGTAILVVEKSVNEKKPRYRDTAGSQAHVPALRSAPQVGHRPRHSSRHWTNGGAANSHCSRIAGLRSRTLGRGSNTNTSGS